MKSFTLLNPHSEAELHTHTHTHCPAGPEVCSRISKFSWVSFFFISFIHPYIGKLHLLQVLQNYIAAEIPTDKRNSHMKKMY